MAEKRIFPSTRLGSVIGFSAGTGTGGSPSPARRSPLQKARARSAASNGPDRVTEDIVLPKVGHRSAPRIITLLADPGEGRRCTRSRSGSSQVASMRALRSGSSRASSMQARPLREWWSGVDACTPAPGVVKWYRCMHSRSGSDRVAALGGSVLGCFDRAPRLECRPGIKCRQPIAN